MRRRKTKRGVQYTHQDLVENRHNQANRKSMRRRKTKRGGLYIKPSGPSRKQTFVIKLTEEVCSVRPKGEDNIPIRT